MLKGCLLGLSLAAGTPAAAATFEHCSRPDAKVAGAAIVGAVDLAMRAAAGVGDTPEFGVWFGSFSVGSSEEVRANLKAIRKELASEDLKAVCLGPQEIDCKEGTYAYVVFDRPRVVHLCPSFFQMPTMAEARTGRVDFEDGTREGTFVHEMSHFPFTAATGDQCYGRTSCSNLARHDARRAVSTADSYQYFSEDVTLSFWRATH